MNLGELIEALDAAVPAGAAPGTRHRAEGVVDTGPQAHQVAIAVRIDPQGRRRETWLCDGIRVEPPLLKRLTCAEPDCPQARAAQAEWQAFLRRRSRGATQATTRSARPPADTAAQPAVLRSGALEVEARPARFPVFLTCPNAAHPPQTAAMTGLDVFEGGEFLVGGLQSGPFGSARPQVRHPAQVQALLDHSRDLAAHLLGRAATGAAS